ncbi:MAG TPA: hypothetical protein VNT30_09250 [Stellaceae bacterium]|nr:hypothetical protein [Stellaceae bacterium]
MSPAQPAPFDPLAAPYAPLSPAQRALLGRAPIAFEPMPTDLGISNATVRALEERLWVDTVYLGLGDGPTRLRHTANPRAWQWRRRSPEERDAILANIRRHRADRAAQRRAYAERAAS